MNVREIFLHCNAHTISSGENIRILFLILFSGEKKMRKIAVMSLFIIAIVASPVMLRAAQWSLGVTSMYMFWEPSWNGTYDTAEVDPFMLYGAIGSVSFSKNWTFSLVGMFGTGEGRLEHEYLGTKTEVEQDMMRFDLDAILSYRFHERFSFFGGLKYIDWNFDANSVTVNNVPANNNYDDHAGAHGMGVGFGLSYNHPIIAQKLFLIANVSFVYMDLYYALFIQGTMQNQNFENDQNYRAYGFNTTLSLSYYFESLSTAIALGGRYQRLSYSAVDEDYYNMDDDILYGITFSVIYYF